MRHIKQVSTQRKPARADSLFTCVSWLIDTGGPIFGVPSFTDCLFGGKKDS